MKRVFLSLAVLAAILLVVCPVSVQAEVFITYGRLDGVDRIIDLQADTPNQEIQFFVAGLAGDGGANGFEFFLQVGDGGAAAGGMDTGPQMTGVDLVSGTIWPASATQDDIMNSGTGPLRRLSTIEGATVVTDDGLLGSVTFDTTGIMAGDIQFLISEIPIGGGSTVSSVFRNVGTGLNTNAPNGILRINAVPEPGSAMILAGLGLVGLCRRRRR